MEIFNKKHLFNYEIEKLCRIFLPFEKILFVDGPSNAQRYVEVDYSEENGVCKAFLRLDGKETEYKNQIQANDLKELERGLAVELYKCFVELTGYTAEWGILTGVRPIKLFSHFEKTLGEEEAARIFAKDF